MKRAIATVWLVLWASELWAAPINFISAEYITGSFATAEGISASHFDSSVLNGLPLLTSAFVTGALAAGTADNSFLGAFTQVDDAFANAGALASAEFIGVFAAPDFFRLALDFDSQSALSNPTTGTEGNLLVRLLNNGVIAFQQTLSASQHFDRLFDLEAGTATLDLLLTSSADATSGSALNLSTVSFQTASIPEPSAFLLSGLGLGLLGLMRLSHRPNTLTAAQRN